ncbi:MAG: hypothetical protein ISS65_11985 [Desulfobacterales bacterium]|nr:hypothetical protein [Desulfobacterales bacterium]
MRPMKTKWYCLKWFCIFLVTGWALAGHVRADSLFKDRRIHLSNDDNRTFKVGVTGTTAGYNFIALIENAKQESISLGDLGYWEMVDDPPSFLRNYDLQLVVKNQYKGKFQIEFDYDRQQHDIRYRVIEGAVQVKLDSSEYYPTLIVDHVASAALRPEEGTVPSGSKRLLFYDFNSFDADLRKYYGSVKRLLKNPDFSHHFYYYESGNYNSYYFKVYQAVEKLDADKMGLSLEDGTLKYYQKVLDNLKSLNGADFADQAIIISRFGKKYSKELKKYAHEIGMSKNMVVTLWSYEDIQ